MAANFVFLTDTHHYPGAPEDYGAPKMLTRSQEVLDAIAPAVNELKPEFIVHGGDLLCGGGSFDLPWETYLRSIDEVSVAFSGFQSPSYYIPGNHDCDAQNGSFDAFARKIQIPEVLDIVDAGPQLRLALANIYHSENPLEDGNGTWTDELDATLREAAEKALADRCAIILIIHTWLIPDYEVGKGTINRADRLLDTISTHPAIVTVYTGHRHLNRIQMICDFLVVDTACLIGFPLGFRQVQLDDDGMFTTTFHQLDLPNLLHASYSRSSPEANNRWQGELYDRDTKILIPRLKEIWS
jgi:3',5'-cyclic AMP phosphodiesterase CpdA